MYLVETLVGCGAFGGLIVASGGVLSAVLGVEWVARAGFVFGLAGFGAVLWTLFLEWRKMLWIVEDDGVGGGGGVSVRRTVRVDARESDHRWTFAEIRTLDEDQLIAVARAVVREGKPFSRRSLCPGCFPAELYAGFRREMLSSGLVYARWAAENADLRVSIKGRLFFEKLLKGV